MAPAAVKKKSNNLKKNNIKIKEKQLSSTLKKVGTSPAFKSVNGKVPNYFNRKRLYSLSQTATYSWKQQNTGDREGRVIANFCCIPFQDMYISFICIRM